MTSSCSHSQSQTCPPWSDQLLLNLEGHIPPNSTRITFLGICTPKIPFYSRLYNTKVLLDFMDLKGKNLTFISKLRLCHHDWCSLSLNLDVQQLGLGQLKVLDLHPSLAESHIKFFINFVYILKEISILPLTTQKCCYNIIMHYAETQ